jgi:hypothetical protein
MRMRTLALFGAAALAVQPQIAAAQANCIAEEEVSAMAIYAVPSVVQAMKLRCSGVLSDNGFLARDADSMARRYSALQARSWPQAKAGLLKIVTSGANVEGAQTIALVAGLPDENVRPLVDALIVQEVSARIPAESCGNAERLVQAIAPIEPQQAGSLIAAIAGLVADEQPLICAANPR